jgi:transposase
MEISSSTLPAVAAEHATMFVALELSKSSWLVALHSPVADKVSLHRFVGGDVAGLLTLIARKQTQAEARLPDDPSSVLLRGGV